MADVDELVGRPEPVAPDDWRVGLAAELVADGGTVLGKAVILSPNIAVTTASVAGRAQTAVQTASNANVPSLSLGLVFPQFSGASSYPLPASILGVDGELRFAVIGFSGQLPVSLPSSLLGTGELPEDGAECSVLYADDPLKGFFRIRGQVERRGDGFVLYVERLPSDASQLMGTPVFFDNRLLGIVTGGPSRSVGNTFLLGVTSVRGMALSHAGSPVRALLPWIDPESRVPSPESRVSPEPRVASPELLGAEVFARLSPSTRGALGRAEGMRIAMGLKEVHMEQLLVGLYEKYGGPTQRLLSDAKIDAPELLKIIHEVRDTEIPTSYSPVSLNTFPPFSEHAHKAMVAATRRSAELQTKLIRSRHLLYGALSVEECGLVKALQDRGVRKENIPLIEPESTTQGEKSQETAIQPVEIFYSYYRTDSRLRSALEKNLQILQQEGLVASWHERAIGGHGDPAEIDEHVNSAQIILLLVSPGYLESPYMDSAELHRALERGRKGEARVIPVILHACEWQRTELAKFQALPSDARPVSEWANYDAAFKNVAEELRRIIPTIPVAKGPEPKRAGVEPTPPTPPPQPFVAAPTPKVDSDLWSEQDRLGYEAYARTIAALITHKETVPPLTIGIKAPWGAGKTSLMKRVQHLLDGRAELSEENRSGARVQGQAPEMTLRQLLRELKELTKADKGLLKTGEMPKLPAPSNTEGEQYGLPPRITVWFNAWKYQTSEQIWAGMAHCIISQVTARMTPMEREVFWLRLHARRINTDEVRRKVHEVLLRTLVPVALIIVLGCAIVFFLASVVPLMMPHQWSIRVVSAFLGLGGVIWKARDTLGEKAAGTVKELVREPDYEGKMGYLHLVESDIREVLNLVTAASSAESRGASSESKSPALLPDGKAPLLAKEARNGAPAKAALSSQVPTPLVVFVDDLDRCAANKVAEVVEAINLFLCGDYPNCIFVLGMEPGMVAAALEVANKEVIEKALEMGVADRSAPVGWRFMEKIVQLPIMIPPPTKEGRDLYVKSLTGLPGVYASRHARDGSFPMTAVGDGEKESVKTGAGEPKPLDEQDVVRFMGELEAGTLKELEVKSEKVLAEAPTEKRREAAEASKRVYARTFSERDPDIVEFVEEVADLVDGNPRQIKRFVNVFRFYSTLRHSLRVDGVVAATDLPSDKVLAKFVALSVQWPHAMDCLRVKNCMGTDGKWISRLEYLERESAKIPGNDVAGDESWKNVLEGLGPGMGSWAQARGFRNFLGRGESLGKSGGHGLW